MSQTQLNILLADDDIDDCIFFKEIVDGSPIQAHLTTVNDGEQLMRRLNNETIELPHLIFLDINMPRKNGIECLSEIKLIPKLRMIPVIMYSTSFELEVVNLLFKNGAHHFIRKPSEFLQFKKIIQQTLMIFSQSLPDRKAGESLQPDREDFVLSL